METGKFTTRAAGALLLALAACGSPIDEKWQGTEGNCSDNVNGTADVRLVLDGPVTASPSGVWQVATSGSSWLENDISDASYVGPSLQFTVEIRTQTFLGTFVVTTRYDLTRTPGKLEGTSETDTGNGSYTCDVSLEPDR